MDYLDQIEIIRHISWNTYLTEASPQRLVLLTAAATQRHVDFAFYQNDTLMVGRESSGVPDEVHLRADARFRVPMRPETRSLNVVTALNTRSGRSASPVGRVFAKLVVSSWMIT